MTRPLCTAKTIHTSIQLRTNSLAHGPGSLTRKTGK
jgi:hypothetical protein